MKRKTRPKSRIVIANCPAIGIIALQCAAATIINRNFDFEQPRGKVRSPPRPSCGVIWLLMAASVLSFEGQALGQESLRMSLAGDMAAESQRQAQNTIGYYNLLWGPVALRFSSGVRFDYDDNVHQSQKGEGDLIVRPNLTPRCTGRSRKRTVWMFRWARVIPSTQPIPN